MNSNENNTTATKKENSRRRRTKGIIKWMWITFTALVIIVFTIFCLIYNGIIGYMPPVEELKNPTDRYATVLYTADGMEMGRYYQSMANRVYVADAQGRDEVWPDMPKPQVAWKIIDWVRTLSV